MIIKRGTRAARSVLGNDFADVWYTFVRSFNQLNVPSRSFTDVFSDDQDKVRADAEKQFFGHVDSLLEQLKILRGIVMKQAKSSEGKIKDALLSLNENLSDTQRDLDEITGDKEDIKKKKEFKSAFGVMKYTVEGSLLDARDNLYLLASLKNTKK